MGMQEEPQSFWLTSEQGTGTSSRVVRWRLERRREGARAEVRGRRRRRARECIVSE